jgi:hypothetical protein
MDWGKAVQQQQQAVQAQPIVQNCYKLPQSRTPAMVAHPRTPTPTRLPNRRLSLQQHISCSLLWDCCQPSTPLADMRMSDLQASSSTQHGQLRQGEGSTCIR